MGMGMGTTMPMTMIAGTTTTITGTTTTITGTTTTTTTITMTYERPAARA